MKLVRAESLGYVVAEAVTVPEQGFQGSEKLATPQLRDHAVPAIRRVLQVGDELEQRGTFLFVKPTVEAGRVAASR